MKRFITLLVGLLVFFSLEAQAANTYFTAARVRSCEESLGTLSVGRSLCSLLYDYEDALVGSGGGALIGIPAASLCTATTVTGCLSTELTTSGTDSATRLGAAATGLLATGTTLRAQLNEICTSGTDGLDNIGAAAVGLLATATTARAQLSELTTSGTDGADNIGAAATGLLATATTLRAQLNELTTSGTNSADNLGYLKAASTAQVTLDGALDKMWESLTCINISVYDFYECNTSAGDREDAPSAAGATEGSGGSLASDSTPRIVGVGATTLQAIEWITTGEHIICTTKVLPSNFSGASNVTIKLFAAADVADADNTEEFDIITNWLVSGSAPGADNAAVTTGALQATDTNVQTLTATVLAANVPDAAIAVSMQLNPDQNTNNNLYLFGGQLCFVSE